MPSKLKLVLVFAIIFGPGWGFFSHRKINRLAVFTLPSEMMRFYKRNLEFIQESAVNPDRRRYAVKGEAECHFIDLDHYVPDTHTMPLSTMDWEEATCWFGEDSLRTHGILPWNMLWTFRRLREAFAASDPERILRLSADLGHYAGDANVPLHTTSNYDGQLTGQHGLHSFWESRLPELNFESYDFLVGRAEYVHDVRSRIWGDILRGHSELDTVLSVERRLFGEMGSVKFSYESRGRQTVRVVSFDYAQQYHSRLRGMVERQFRSSVRLAADLWYTAWVDAGQPDLGRLEDYRPDADAVEKRKQELLQWKQRYFWSRDHESEERLE